MMYAMYDTTARRSNPGHGFANTKAALAFSTEAKMDAFLFERIDYDYSARRITRCVAMTMLESVYGQADKGLWLDGTPDKIDSRMVTLRKSKY